MVTPTITMAADDERILNFRERFNLQSFVYKHLTSENGEAEPVCPNACIVGQESDGSILITWEAREAEGSPAVITKIGHYSITKDSFREIYRHNEKAHVTAATVNPSLTLLAFTIKEDQSDTGNLSLFAEIQPQGRVFFLEEVGRSPRKLQFLMVAASSLRPKQASRLSRYSHFGSSTGSQAQCSISKLLAIIPNECILLYTFQLQSSPTGTRIVSWSSEADRITSNGFDWYQWDPHQQWLFYVRIGSNPNLLMFSILSFGPDVWENVLSLCLPLPHNRDWYLTKAPPSQVPIDLVTPTEQLNLCVLYSKKEDHLMCVCLQHRTVSKSPQVSDADYVQSEEIHTIEYSVFMIHNGHVIHGQIPWNVASGAELLIHFMLLGRFVAAYVPGVMLHLLNVSPQADPCHHLVLDAGLTPPFPLQPPNSAAGADDDGTVGPTLCNAVSVSDWATVLECRTQTVFDCVLCPMALLAMFKKTSNGSLRISLLNLAITAFRYNNLANAMVEHVCQRPVSLETHQIFAEYILAFAYTSLMVNRHSRYISNQLPLTTVWPSFRGSVYRSERGTYALLRIQPIEESFENKLLVLVNLGRSRLETPDDFFRFAPNSDAVQEVLYYNVMTTEPKLKRISIASVLSQRQELSAAAAGDSVGSRKSRGPKFVTKIVGHLKQAIQPSNHSKRRSASASLPFLTPDEDLEVLLVAEAECLRTALIEAVGADVPYQKVTVSEAIMSYLIDLEDFSCDVLKIIWISLDLGRDTHPLNGTLYRVAEPREHILFELLEAYQCAHVELSIPLPNGFYTLYTCLGFVCLEPVVFLQYVLHGAFIVTKSFVEKAIENSKEAEQLGAADTALVVSNREKDELLYHILCDLPARSRDAAFRDWNKSEVLLNTELLSK